MSHGSFYEALQMPLETVVRYLDFNKTEEMVQKAKDNAEPK